MSSAWSYEAREGLCKRVSELGPPSLSDVVHIIYGHDEEIVSGDEFLVDFASLTNETCSRLHDYLTSQKGAGAADDENDDDDDDLAILLGGRDGLVSLPPPPTPKVNVDVVRDVRGSLPSCRIVLPGNVSSSVLACRGQRHLFLSDEDFSLEWRAPDKRPEEDERSSAEKDNVADASECFKILTWLQHLDVVQPFLKPVDPLFAPLYDHVVDRPSDLGTVSKKLCKGEYSSGSEFASDVRLVHRNAVAYCERGPSPDAAVYRAAQVFIAAFEGRWRRLVDDHKKKSPGKKKKGFGKVAAPDRHDKKTPPNAPSPPPPNRRLEIFSNNQWRPCLLGEYRKRDKKYKVEYETGRSAWIDLTKETYRAAEPPAKKQKKGEISVQKLGILVWAKSGDHPWWPAELCLPTTDRIVESLPPPSKKQHAAAATRFNFVYYFGETQYDILDVANVQPFDAMQKPNKKNNKDLYSAYLDAMARRAELGDDV